MSPEGDGHARALARAREYSRSVESSDASRARASAPVRASWAGGAPTTVPTPEVARASPVKPRPNLKFFGNTVRAIASANARIDDKRRAEGERERDAAARRRGRDEAKKKRWTGQETFEKATRRWERRRRRTLGSRSTKGREKRKGAGTGGETEAGGGRTRRRRVVERERRVACTVQCFCIQKLWKITKEKWVEKLSFNVINVIVQMSGGGHMPRLSRMDAHAWKPCASMGTRFPVVGSTIVSMTCLNMQSRTYVPEAEARVQNPASISD